MSRRLLLAALGAVAACAGANGARQAKRPEVAVRRGSAWLTYSFDLPRIIGPTVQLELERGRLRGFVASGALDVRIDAGGARGFGPRGPVNLTVTSDGARVAVDGLWNGGTVHFTFAPSQASGSVIVRPGRPAVDEISCFYRLDRLDRGGALYGFSTCAGMPQDARLEVDARLRDLITPTELAVFLVAAFSAPPLVPGD